MRIAIYGVVATVFVGGCATGAPIALSEAARACESIKPEYAEAPRYPIGALTADEQGSVEIRFDVAPDGTTANHEVVSSTSGRTFNAAAIRAIEKWRFPASADGCRNATYTIHFEVEQGTNWPPRTQ